jgi:hypothetical protein
MDPLSSLPQALAEYRRIIQQYNQTSFSAVTEESLSWVSDGSTTRDDILITDGTRPPVSDLGLHLRRLRERLLEIASPDISDLDLPSDYVQLMSLTDGLDIQGLDFEQDGRVLIAAAEDTEAVLNLDPSTERGRRWIDLGRAYGATADLARLRELCRYENVTISTAWRCGGGGGEGLDIFYAYVKPTQTTDGYNWRIVWCGHGDIPLIFNNAVDLMNWYGASVKSLLPSEEP